MLCISNVALHLFFDRGDSSSIYMFELTEKDKVHSYKMTWDTYLHSLKQNECTESVTGMVILFHVSHLHPRKLYILVMKIWIYVLNLRSSLSSSYHYKADLYIKK